MEGIKLFFKREIFQLKNVVQGIFSELQKDKSTPILQALQTLTEETKKKSVYTQEIKIEIDPEEIRGRKGDEGKPGMTPKKGEDYFTAKEIEDIRADVFGRIRVPEDGKPGKAADEVAIKKSLKSWIASLFNEVQSKLFKKQTDFEKTVQKQLPKWSDIQKEIKAESKRNKPVLKTIHTTVKEIAKAFDLSAALDNMNVIKLIARGLERLKGQDRLSAKAIKNLPYGGTNVPLAAPSTSSSLFTVTKITTANGVLRSFTVASNPQVIFLRGTAYFSPESFTVSGTGPYVITLADNDIFTPQASDPFRYA